MSEQRWDGMVATGTTPDGCNYMVHVGPNASRQEILWAVWSLVDAATPVRQGVASTLRDAMISVHSGEGAP